MLPKSAHRTAQRSYIRPSHPGDLLATGGDLLATGGDLLATGISMN